MDALATARWLEVGACQNFQNDGKLSPCLVLVEEGGDGLFLVPTFDQHPTDAFKAMSTIAMPLGDFAYVGCVVEAWAKTFHNRTEPPSLDEFPRGTLEKMEAEGDTSVVTTIVITVLDIKESVERGTPWGYGRHIQPQATEDGWEFTNCFWNGGGEGEPEMAEQYGAMPDALLYGRLTDGYEEMVKIRPPGTLADWGKLLDGLPFVQAVMVMLVKEQDG